MAFSLRTVEEAKRFSQPSKRKINKRLEGMQAEVSLLLVSGKPGATQPRTMMNASRPIASRFNLRIS